MPRFLRLALLPLTLVLGAADNPQAVIAERGAVRMTAGELEALLALLDQPTRERLRANSGQLAELVRERLLRDTLLAEARAAKWDARPDVTARAEDARIQVIIQTFISSKTLPLVTEPTEAEINQAYEATKARLVVPRQYNMSQIAVLIPANASKETEEELRKKALDIRAQLTKPKADFAEIARKQSQDKPSADKGGELGWVREDVLIPAIRSVAPSLKENTISDPIRGADSWHLVRVNGTRPAGVMTLDQARESIVTAIKQARAQAAVRNFMQETLRADPIKLNEIELARQFPPPPAAR